MIVLTGHSHTDIRTGSLAPHAVHSHLTRKNQKTGQRTAKPKAADWREELHAGHRPYRGRSRDIRARAAFTTGTRARTRTRTQAHRDGGRRGAAGPDAAVALRSGQQAEEDTVAGAMLAAALRAHAPPASAVLNARTRGMLFRQLLICKCTRADAPAHTRSCSRSSRCWTKAAWKRSTRPTHN